MNNVIECIPDEMWDKLYCEMPLWKHVYHMLMSLDASYINPRNYEAPSFHVKDLNNLDIISETKLSPELLKEFFKTVELKIKDYNNSLTDQMLLEKPENSKWPRFALILGQHRHLHSHMGMIMGFIIVETGMWPRVTGMDVDIPVGDYDKFY